MLSLDKFASQIVESGLMESGELAAIREQHQPVDAETLARLLVKQKRLTAYQAQQAYAGKAKSLVLGNYLILDKLGQGGMGMVLKARHRRMDRLVALKVLSPAVVKTPDLLSRFHREVKAAAKLQHPNIVMAFDADEANSTHFLVMEYVEGADLSALIKKSGPLPVDQAIHHITQAARGLEFAHKHGVIHRDIKPANLLLDSHGTVKILDMGLARIEGETGTNAELTSTGAVMGTVDYMAPEQALSTKTADARSDIYSLGITLWYLLNARPAYDGDSLMARLMAHANNPIPSLKAARANIPDGLDTVYQKMVAKKPADRFQTMTDVVAALESCRTSAAGDSRTSPGGATGPSEDSRLSEMLALFGGGADPSAVTQALTARKGTGTTRPAQASEFEKTVTSGKPDADTDPTTLTSLRKTAGPQRTRRAQKQNWWQDKRIQIGAGLAAVLLVVVVIATTRRGGSPPSEPLANGTRPTDVTPNIPAPSKVETAASSNRLTTPQPVSFAAPPSDSNSTEKARYPKDKADLPDGFVPLFNGKDLTGWKGQVLDPRQRVAMSDADLSIAQVKADNSMRAHWSVENGVLSFDGKGDNLCSARDYADFELYLEWKIETGGDTGVHLRGSPQVQIWDSAAKEQANNLGSGGLYNNLKHASRPLVNADKPIGEWNAMLIRMVGEKVTVSLNGQLVVDDVIFENYVERDKPIYPSGPIELQNFRTPVQFRNLLIREVNSRTDRSPSAADGWTPLFDGKTLNGWETIGEGGWSAADGVLKAAGTGKGWIGTTQTFRDYELELEYRIQAQGNGGIALRAWKEGGISAKPFFEVQIIDDTAANPNTDSTGSITGHVLRKPGLKAPLGEWNKVAVRLEGKRVVVTVNGATTVDADLPIERAEGMIGLQVWDRPVEYRNLQVRSVGKGAAKGVPLSDSSKSEVGTRSALRFQGLGQYIDHTKAQVRLDQPWTVESWVTPHEVELNGSENRLLFSAEKVAVAVRRHPAGHLQWWVSPGGYYSDSPITPDRRTHVALVHESNRLSLFVDGRLQGTPRSTQYDAQPALFSATPSNYSARPNPTNGNQNGNGFLGEIDEVRVSQAARYRQSFIPEDSFATDDKTLLLYHFDEGTGTTVKDSSANGLHGRIVGATWVKLARTADEISNAQSPPSGTADDLKNSRSIELLPLVDLQRDAGVGNWKRVADGIACENPAGANVLQLPYEPPEEYDFEIEFTTTGAGNNVNQYIAAASRMFAWKLNSHRVTPPLYGFELLDGKLARDFREAATQISQPIEDGRRYRSTVEVRRGSLRALLDGKELVKWSGDFKRLSVESVTPMPHAGRPGIGSWRRPVTFHAARVREVSGTGKLVGSAKANPDMPNPKGNPWLSPDSLVLLFDSDRGHPGNQDLYFCTRPTANASIGPPQALGPAINTTSDGIAPCLSADGRELSFYSDRPGGLGAADIWMSRRTKKP